MLSKPHFPKFRIAEVLQFLSDILTVCFHHNPDGLKLTEKVADLKAQTDLLDTLFKNDQGSDISDELADIDQLRDACLTGIRKGAEAFTYHYKESINKAAIKLLDSIDRNGKNLTKLNYPAETATIDKIVADWNNDSSLAEAITTLNFSDWATELKRLNTLFNQRYIDRTGESASKPEISATDQRKVAIHSYYKLASEIDAHAVLDKEGAYNGLVNEQNVLTDKYNRMVDLRSDKSKKDDPDKAPKI